MPKKKLNIISRLFLLIICLVLVLEIYARWIVRQPYYAFPQGYFVSNELYGYALAANFKGTYSQPEFTISIDTNSQGLRDVGHILAAGSFKILSLGDSFSFGIGVELRDTYLSLLEAKLNGNTRGKKYTVIKAGIPGYSSYNERVYLETKGLEYRPNMVIVQFSWDDLGIGGLTYLADTGLLTTGKIKDFAHLRLFLNHYFRSYALLRRLFVNVFQRAAFPVKILTAADTAEQIKGKIKITLDEFNKILTFCRKNNIPCLFVLIPPKEFVTSKTGLPQQWQLLCDSLKNNDTRYIDLLPVLKKGIKENKYPYYTVDPHLNKAGHRLIAEAIYNFSPP